MKQEYVFEDYAQKKLKEGKYLIIYCMTEASAHFFYRLYRGNDSQKHKGYPELFFFKSIGTKKGAGAVHFLKNNPKTWLILAGAFKRYGNDIMVWGSNRVYNFHLPNQIQLVSEKRFNKLIRNKELDNFDENLAQTILQEVMTVS